MDRTEDKVTSEGTALSALMLAAVLIFSAAIVSCHGGEFPMRAYERAYGQMIDGDYKSAAASFRRLSESSPAYPEIWYGWGTCLMETERYAQAVQAFSKAADLYGNSVLYDDKAGLRRDAMTAIGEVYLMQGDLMSAEAEFVKCLSERADTDTVIAISATYIRMGYADRVMPFLAGQGLEETAAIVFPFWEEEKELRHGSFN